jgi:hypothetical protein
MPWILPPGFHDFLLEEHVVIAVGSKIVISVKFREIGEMGNHVARTSTAAPAAAIAMILVAALAAIR